jgi:PEP-CTERM motif-containing protein
LRVSKQVGRVVGLLAVLLCARVGYATPVAYDEAVSGDLSSGFPATLFTLDVGSNTVTGTTGGVINTSGDSDNFAFVVPGGMHVADITFASTATLLGGATSLELTYAVGKGNQNVGSPPPNQSNRWIGDIFINNFGGPPVHLAANLLPLSAGTYIVQAFGAGFGSSGTPGDGFTVNYTWTLDVVADAAAVPEPASLGLLSTGLISIGARRWRNRHQRC